MHYHVLLAYEPRVDIRDPFFWDVGGRHPNIQAARNWKQVLSYVLKDDTEAIIHGFARPGGGSRHLTVVREEMGNNDNPTKALQVIIDRTGTKGLKMYNNIAAYIDRVMHPTAVHQPIMDWPPVVPTRRRVPRQQDRPFHARLCGWIGAAWGSKVSVAHRRFTLGQDGTGALPGTPLVHERLVERRLLRR